MSETPHTPGPWTVRQSVYNGGAYDVHYAIETVDKQPEHPWSVRVVAWMTGGIRNDLSLNSIPSAKYCKECSRWHLYDREIGVDTRRDPKIEADARLIAAAPDLYEALKELLMATPASGDMAHVERITRARTALSKASQQQGSPQDTAP